MILLAIFLLRSIILYFSLSYRTLLCSFHFLSLLLFLLIMSMEFLTKRLHFSDKNNKIDEMVEKNNVLEEMITKKDSEIVALTNQVCWRIFRSFLNIKLQIYFKFLYHYVVNTNKKSSYFEHKYCDEASSQNNWH